MPQREPHDGPLDDFVKQPHGFFIISSCLLIASVLFIIIVVQICRKLCWDRLPPEGPRPPAAPMPQGVPPPPPAPGPPSPAPPEGLDPPPYSEVTAKPFLYPYAEVPCVECGLHVGAQPPLPPPSSP